MRSKSSEYGLQNLCIRPPQASEPYFFILSFAIQPRTHTCACRWRGRVANECSAGSDLHTTWPSVASNTITCGHPNGLAVEDVNATNESAHIHLDCTPLQCATFLERSAHPTRARHNFASVERYSATDAGRFCAKITRMDMPLALAVQALD
eukprot:2971101-Rhodomonas_salina.4